MPTRVPQRPSSRPGAEIFESGDLKRETPSYQNNNSIHFSDTPHHNTTEHQLT